MTYARPHRLGRGLGDDSITSILAGLPGAATGAALGLDASAMLAAQVNRFAGGGVPDDLRVADHTFPVVSGKVEPSTAQAAMTILQRRAFDDNLAFGDAGSAAALVASIQNQANPQAYVMANLALVTDTVQQYGDIKGLPPASPTGALSRTVIVAVGAAAVLLAVLLSKKRKA